MEVSIEKEKKQVGKAIDWVSKHCSILTVVLLSLILVTMCTSCASYHGFRKKGENFFKNQDIKTCMKSGMSKEECERL